MTRYTVELSDVTPNRATVRAVHEGEVTAGSRHYAVVDGDMRPEIGERVWVRRNPIESRGAVEITARG